MKNWACAVMRNLLCRREHEIPPEVRKASHDLSNAAMAAEGSAKRLQKEVDVLASLAEVIRREARKDRG